MSYCGGRIDGVLILGQMRSVWKKTLVEGESRRGRVGGGCWGEGGNRKDSGEEEMVV